MVSCCGQPVFKRSATSSVGESHSPLEITPHKAGNGARTISCRNRHCPKCQAQARQRWLAARERELLGVPSSGRFAKRNCTSLPPTRRWGSPSYFCVFSARCSGRIG